MKSKAPNIHFGVLKLVDYVLPLPAVKNGDSRVTKNEYMEFSLDSLTDSSIQVIPILFLLAVGLILMILDAFKSREVLPFITALGLLGSAILAIVYGDSQSHTAFSGMMETGGIAPLVHVFLCLSGLFTQFFLSDYLRRQAKPISDVYALLVFSVIGMILMANANNLIMTFIGLETMSIALYIFAGLYKADARSNESGMKYFLLGSFASAFLLFGISLIYGIAGTLDLSEIASGIAQNKDFLHGPTELLFYTGAGLILIGFLFKVSAFPFHNWTPDVYEGTPTPLAGFMATGSKMAAFVALGVVMNKMDFFALANTKLITVIALAAFLTMIYGNIVAARQQNLKRMLAYSSIAHSGYVLLGLCAGKEGFIAVIFYMAIYTLMNIGAFGLVAMAESDYGDTNMERWRGMGFKSPYFAAALSIFLFSLAGIPPLAGFMGKYFVFITAIRADLILLATIGILSSVIGAYYYIRVIMLMYFGKDETPEITTSFNAIPLTGAAILVVLILLLGMAPDLIMGPIGAAFHAGPEAYSVLP